MTYWYAAQGVVRTYKASIEDGFLWTCPPAPGKRRNDSRTIICQLVQGDIVFHHSEGCLSAVSIVTESSERALRPSAHYPRPEGEKDDGWRVEVHPVETGLDLSYKEVAQRIEIGSPGPFNTAKVPQNGRFLSRLPDKDGTRLLQRLGLEYVYEGLYGRPITEWVGGETDALSIATIRNEQPALRRHLLEGRMVASCSLCQAELPDRLLIAGHIKPRAFCSEEERKDFRAAMLICSLGCDALFEWGYIVVAPNGRIEPGIPAETETLESAVATLSGQQCTAHDEVSAARFEFHRQLKVGQFHQ